jgi:hypothetical protein
VLIFHKQYTEQRAEELLRCSIHQSLLRCMPRDGLHQAEGTGLTAANRQCTEMTRSMKQIPVLSGLIESSPKSRTLVAHDENPLVV